MSLHAARIPEHRVVAHQRSILRPDVHVDKNLAGFRTQLLTQDFADFDFTVGDRIALLDRARRSRFQNHYQSVLDTLRPLNRLAVPEQIKLDTIFYWSARPITLGRQEGDPAQQHCCQRLGFYLYSGRP